MSCHRKIPDVEVNRRCHYTLRHSTFVVTRQLCELWTMFIAVTFRGKSLRTCGEFERLAEVFRIVMVVVMLVVVVHFAAESGKDLANAPG
ncbi:MAG: hypothetical protein P1V20_16220 [Verrucomicrobiales bacterium]|nr:hypothetical protein [Verrucomicrobiales bacterium]